MGILKRTKNVVKANINSFLKKAEDPAKMVDQIIRDLKTDLVVIRRDTANLLADSQAADRKRDDCKKTIRLYNKAIKRAVKAKEDEDAKKLIAKKQSYEKMLETFEEQAESLSKAAREMKDKHDNLLLKIQDLENRQGIINAQVSIAKTQEHINNITANGNDQSSIASFDEMEEKATKMAESAKAEAEMIKESNADEDLAKKYLDDINSSVEEELARIKEEL
jgi:phage shock protein A